MFRLRGPTKQTTSVTSSPEKKTIWSTNNERIIFNVPSWRHSLLDAPNKNGSKHRHLNVKSEHCSCGCGLKKASINTHSQSTQRVCLTRLNASHATSHHEKLTSWKIICGKGKKRFPLQQTLGAQPSAQMFMGPVWVRLVRQGAPVRRRAGGHVLGTDSAALSLQTGQCGLSLGLSQWSWAVASVNGGVGG